MEFCGAPTGTKPNWMTPLDTIIRRSSRCAPYRILLGIKDDGTPSGWNPANALGSDAQVVDKIAKYTGEQF